MSLASAFTTAWKDLKADTIKVASFVINHGTNIQTTITTVAGDVAKVVPSIAPEITVFDTAEEAAMGTLLAVASDVKNATTLQGLFGDAWPAIQALVTQLESHPAVVAAAATVA
jgi:hypothetical protein